MLVAEGLTNWMIFESWIMLDDVMDHVVDPSQNVQASGDVD